MVKRIVCGGAKMSALAVLLLVLAACGGGGSGSSGGGSASNSVSGVASKGLIANGVIKVFAVNADSSLRLLVSTTTDAAGKYSADIGPYAGPLLVQASGSYTDEATGAIKTVPADSPLRAALPGASGAVSMAVTPLTELAVVKAGSSALTATSISAANALISDLFKVDIVGTQPVAPTAAALQDSATSSTQKDYTIALAAVSQMMSSGTSLAGVISTLNSGISSSGMSVAAAQGFQDSLAQFVSNPKNNTGVTSASQVNLGNVGGLTASYLLASTSVQSPQSIKGIQMTLTLPPGTSCRVDANGALLSSSLRLSGVAPLTSLNLAKFTPATATSNATVKLALINATGFGLGEFATLVLDLAPGVAKPAPGALGIAGFSAITDVSGTVNPAITPVVSLAP